MNNNKYYSDLGLSPGASKAEVEKAYNQLARKYHPDKFRADPKEFAKAEAKMRDINAAYQAITSGEADNPFSSANASDNDQSYSFNFSNFGNSQTEYSDFFDNIFNNFVNGGQQGQRHSNRAKKQFQPKPGEHVVYNIAVSLEEILEGVNTILQIKNVYRGCLTCKGAGVFDKLRSQCDHCMGTGTVVTSKGFWRIEDRCPKCIGTGVNPNAICKACKGEGRQISEDTITLNTQKGFYGKHTIPQKGHAGANGGQAGNLIINLNVKEHTLFTLKGNDVHCSITITAVEAILGTTITIPLGSNRVVVNVPPNTQHTSKVIVKRQGLPGDFAYIFNKSGDFIAEIHVEMPRQNTPELVALVEKIQKLTEGNSRNYFFPDANSFANKIQQ